MPNGFRLTLLALAGLLALAPAPRASAALGETFNALKERLGRPLPSEKKNVHVWLIEVIDGQLSYTVTFNAQNRSIAEGIRPIKRARFTPDLARDFIATQTRALANSPTLRTVHPGEKYTFARHDFTCGPDESVTVDDPQGVLIIWTKAPIPSIMAVSPEMLPPAPAAK
jgi:hypothetical protein